MSNKFYIFLNECVNNKKFVDISHNLNILEPNKIEKLRVQSRIHNNC